MIDLKIFLDTDEDIRLSKRVYKNCVAKNKSLDECVEQYLKV